MQTITVFGTAFVLSTLVAGVASAQTSCAELGGNIIYGIGGSAQTPLIGQVASRLRAPEDDAAQLTLIYAEPGGCYAFGAFDVTKSEEERRIAATPTGTTAKYWNQGSTTAQICVLADDVLADFSMTSHDDSFCADAGELAEDVGTFKGPVGTLNVVVPEASSERSISAAALYFLFKFGDAAQVAPWTDERYVVLNGVRSAVLQSIGKAVGFQGAFEHGSGASINAAAPIAIVANAGVHGGLTTPNPDATIGFASGENAETHRGQVRTLAYQHFDQTCAFWPDSSATTFDKLNVRTGRYALWTSLRVLTRVGESDEIEDPDVARLVDYVTRPTSAPTELPLLDIIIDSYNVPLCAMQVERSEDFGPLASYQPDEPCGCYFEQRATGRTSCATCESDDDCAVATPSCRLGYCEAR